MDNPTENLLGIDLDGGWLVTEKVSYGHHHTGANFSICYKVTKGKETAFLKAIDLSRALGRKDMNLLHKMTTAYHYEAELLELCDGHKMDRIVKILGKGSVIPLINNPNNHFVPYFIFELAETTIGEHVLEIAENLDNSCLMRSLHHVAVAISQLHSAGIVHQDIKGSNVLLFDKSGNCKLADLGRAENQSKRSMYYLDAIAGDPDYAPPEQIYDDINDDWEIRRKSTDLYHLGSLIAFYYTQSSMTSLYRTYIPTELRSSTWNGRYSEILSHFKAAFQEILEYVEGQLIDRFSDPEIVSEILKLVKCLCDPDPSKRGHPDSDPANRYSMIRIITILDRLATKFDVKLL